MEIKVFWIFIWLSQNSVLGANILFVAVDPAPSHMNSFKPIIEELLNRGHKVTAIVHNELQLKSTNFTEISVEPKIDLVERFSQLNVFDKRKVDCNYGERSFRCFKVFIGEMGGTLKHGRASSNIALRSLNVQKFIKSNKEKFDVVIAEMFAQEPMYMFAHKYNAPLILISSFDYDFPAFQAIGIYSIWSNIPQLQGTFDLFNSFFKRLYDRFFTAVLVLVRKAVHINECNRIIADIFGPLEKLPSVKEIERNVSLVMFNSLEILAKSKLREHGFINIAGVHIPTVQPLRQYFKKFLDEANQGAIYFSLGSIVSTTTMPEESLKSIITAFSKLKMKVLWKFDDSSKGNLPKNVLAKSWFPQNDVLAHKNIKLFITHGGIAGIQESIYHAVPMIVIPIFGDQFQNAIKVENANIGMHLNFQEITTDRLLSAIKNITQNKKYYENIRRISEEFKSGGTNPLKNAVFWIEHVAKFKDTQHLKPRNYDVAWYEYLGLDIIAIIVIFFKFVITIILIILSKIGVFRLFRSIISKIRPKNQEVPQNKNEKKKKKQ